MSEVVNDNTNLIELDKKITELDDLQKEIINLSVDEQKERQKENFFLS